MLDDLDFMAPMRSRFAIPEYNGQHAIYFATHANGLIPISAQYIQQHYYKKWNNYHVLQPDRWQNLVEEQHHDISNFLGKLLDINAQHLAFDQDGQSLLKQLVDDFPNISHCYTIDENLPDIFKQYYALEYCCLPESQLNTDGIVRLIEAVIEPNSLFYLPSISHKTGNAFFVDAIRKAAIDKGIVVVWDISLAVNNMDVDLHSANILYAVFRTNAYLSGGNEPIYVTYARKRIFDSHSFPLLNAASLIASVDLLAKTSIKEIRKKSNDLFTYFSLLITELSPSYKIITNHDTVNLSGYFVIHTNHSIYDELLKGGFVVTSLEEKRIAISFNSLYNTYQDVYRLFLILKDIKDNA